MANIEIIKYQPNYRDSVEDICYRTGYLGEDLTNKKVFEDRKLFSYLFCLYYLLYEKENCFIALDRDNNKVAGYIIGTMDTVNQKKLLVKKMTLMIAARFFTVTLVKYNESFKTIINFIFNWDLKLEPKFISREYPAHLHINLDPDYQRCGIGSLLLEKFEEHVKASGVKGIHLKTTDKNIKAVPFYIKHGYSILYETNMKLWRDEKDYKSIIFGKKLIN